MTTENFDLLIQSLLDVVAMSRRLQGPSSATEPQFHAVPVSTSAEQWRELIDRLNAADPAGGWGRATIMGVQCVATKGEWTV